MSASRFASLLALAALALSACDDPTVVRTPPPAPRELTMIAIIDPDRTIQHVHVAPVSVLDTLENVEARLYEDGILVETDLAPAPAPDDPRLERCRATSGGVLRVAIGLCLEFDYWPRHGAEYRIEIDADGFPTVSGTTAVPASFQIVNARVEGAPPGTEGLDLTWTESGGAGIYIVSLTQESPDCAGSSCMSGWFTDTDQLRISTVVPRDQLVDGEGDWIIHVRALNPALYQFLTTGAEGELFVVPPVQNVANGHGVVGAWTNRAIFHGQIEAPVRRGDWNVAGRPLPGEGSFSPRRVTGSAAGGVYVFEGGWDRFYRWSDTASGWSLVRDGGRTYPLGRAARGIIVEAYDTASNAATILRVDDDGSAPEPIALFLSPPVSAHVSEDGLWLLTFAANPGEPLIMLRSEDDGATFDTVSLPIDPALESWIDDVAEAPEGTLYAPVSTGWAGSAARPVLYSADRGVSWEIATGTIPGDVSEIEAGAGGRLYAGVLSDGAGVYVSDDRAGSWQRTFFERVDDLVADPDVPGRLWFAAARNEFDSNLGGVYESTDGGETFTSTGLENAQVLGLVYDPGRPALFTVEGERGLLVRAVP